MLIVFSRALILYFFIVVIFRLMGKKQIGELQPTELVVALVMADLASVPMENVDTPLINGIVPILTLYVAEELLSYISMKSEKARGIICGKPSILIQKGIIVEKEMKRLRYNMNDLLEQIRLNGFSNIKDVNYAILETSGELSTFPIESKRPVTISDLNLEEHIDGFPLTIIIDGKIHSYNLSTINLDERWLYKQLQKNNIDSPKDVFFAYCTNDKNFYFQLKESRKKREV